MSAERDAVRELIAAVERWDNAGNLKVMHVLTCAECKRLEKDEERWCSQAQVIGRRQIEAAQLLKEALAPARAALAAHPAPPAIHGFANTTNPAPPATDDDDVIRDLVHALGPHASGCYTCKAAMKRNAARIAAALQRAAGEPHGQA